MVYHSRGFHCYLSKKNLIIINVSLQTIIYISCIAIIIKQLSLNKNLLSNKSNFYRTLCNQSQSRLRYISYHHQLEDTRQSLTIVYKEITMNSEEADG